MNLGNLRMLAATVTVLVMALFLVFGGQIAHTLTELPAVGAHWQRRMRYRGRHWR